ncbi:MAG: energy transducer TonB, partial [Ferruginibacter sp.]|nr:energy transducer TonB [Cytophagales bacterium]
VTKAAVVKGIGKECDEEALKLVSQMPNWKPGLHQGEPVPVKYILPVRFIID